MSWPSGTGPWKDTGDQRGFLMSQPCSPIALYTCISLSPTQDEDAEPHGGDWVGFLIVHSCLAINKADAFKLLKANPPGLGQTVVFIDSCLFSYCLVRPFPSHCV